MGHHHYRIEWYHVGKKEWITTYDNLSEGEVEEGLKKDQGYFYSDVLIRVVRVDETIVRQVMGGQSR